MEKKMTKLERQQQRLAALGGVLILGLMIWTIAVMLLASCRVSRQHPPKEFKNSCGVRMVG